MIFIDRSFVEGMVGDVPINLYEQRTAEIIAYTLGMLFYFENSDTIISTFSEKPVGCRLATLGISSLEEGPNPINLLYRMDNPRMAEFFYGIPGDEISTNSSLMRQINEHMEAGSNALSAELSFSYSVVPVDTTTSYLLGVFYTSEPQPLWTDS